MNDFCVKKSSKFSSKFHQNFQKFQIFWPKTLFFARCRFFDFFLKKRKNRKNEGLEANFCPSSRATRLKFTIFCHFLAFFRFPLQSKGIPHFPRKSTATPLDDFFMIFWVSSSSSKTQKSKKSFRMKIQNFRFQLKFWPPIFFK